MSKVSAMQALREARYAASRTSRPAAPASTVSPSRATPATPGTGRRTAASTDGPGDSAPDAALPAPGGVPAPAGGPADSAGSPGDVAESDAPVEALCGHRSMNNRTCRRPAGHPEKNHRYS